MVKPTQGPWKAQGQQVMCPSPSVSVAYCGETMIVGIDGYRSISKDECLANARLIAAAPDLLEALLPFARITFAHTVWADKDDDAAVLYDHATGNRVTLGDFKRVVAAIARTKENGNG